MASHCRLLVTTGLDPVVHADEQLSRMPVEALRKPRFDMDCRIKSGNDEGKERTKEIRRRNADRRNRY
jgi:hypothetical protein